jgi:hypothetical protein
MTAEYQRRQSATKKEPIMVDDYVAECCGTCQSSHIKNSGECICQVDGKTKNRMGMCFNLYRRDYE